MPYRLSENNRCVQILRGGAWRTLRCYANERDARDFLTALNLNVGSHIRKAPVRYADIDFKPNTGMIAEAKRGLEWRREFGRGGTGVGIARARDIANGRNLSPETVKRMFSFFSRHENVKRATGFRPSEQGYPSNGRIAWALWGGDAGFAWSRQRVNQMNRADENQKSAFKALGGGRWLAFFTNDFLDRDGEILKSTAHEDYVKRVQSGAVPMPELWVWHKAGTRLGVADYVDRVEHVTYALGKFDDTPQGKEAEQTLLSSKDAWKLSHGFSYPIGSKQDKVYQAFNTFEISLLPEGAESNPYTDFVAIKESNTMPLTDAQQETIKKLLPTQAPTVIEAVNSQEKVAKTLESLGVTFKALKEEEVKMDGEKPAEEKMDEEKEDGEEMALIVAELSASLDTAREQIGKLTEYLGEAVEMMSAEGKARKSLEVRVKELEKALGETPQSVKAQNADPLASLGLERIQKAIGAKSKTGADSELRELYPDLFE